MRFERLPRPRAAPPPASHRLPALLLVDEDGAVHEVCSPDGSTPASRRSPKAPGPRRRVATPALGFDDFRLPQVGREGLVSFLDVAGRENTMVAFLHTGCLPCARQLEVLDFARDRQAGG